MSRWIALVSLCITACVSEVDEQRVDDEDTAEAAQELILRKCSVWWEKQLILENGYYYPDYCCALQYCHPCEIYSCTFP